MQSLGWNVLGVEPDPVSAALAKKRGIQVFNGTLSDACLPEGVADQINMQHVIEHLSDPLSAIVESFRLLRKGGRLVIYTPNNESLGHRVFRSAWRGLEPPRHLFIFSPESLNVLFAKSPFHEWKIRTLSRSALSMFDSSMLIVRQTEGNTKKVIHKNRERTIFGLKEALMCRLGFSRGEVVEVVACRR
jgi:SAM-dependent methyltransferase